MSAPEILTEIKALSGNTPLMVSLSGGNPAIQPLGDLITMGQSDGYQFALETQGSIAQGWFNDLDVLTLSPKPPSSGEDTDWDKLTQCIHTAGDQTKISLKIVVFDEADYIYARTVSDKHPDLPIYLQPGNHQTDGTADMDGLYTRLRWLADRVAHDQWFTARVLPQLHVMMWGNERGV